jgi:hypothetical protein
MMLKKFITEKASILFIATSTNALTRTLTSILAKATILLTKNIAGF